LATVEADGADAQPAALDTDVAGFDVALAYPGLGSAFRGVGAEVVWLESHGS
jgi:hypothetical protein